MTFAEFETYARCPLQHWYRNVLDLPGEQQVDISVRARWAIDEALKVFAADKSLKIRDVFVAAWDAQKLPGKVEDKQLWEHAAAVFKEGVELIRQSGGTYSEPKTAVDGFPIQLPWLLLSATKSRPTVDVVKVHVSDLRRSVAFWRPMLNGLRPRDADQVTIHSLLDHAEMGDGPSKVLTSTNPYKAVQRWRAGDSQPVVGKHCGWCAYSTFCPTRPAE